VTDKILESKQESQIPVNESRVTFPLPTEERRWGRLADARSSKGMFDFHSHPIEEARGRIKWVG
jgi:hypothetical protein